MARRGGLAITTFPSSEGGRSWDPNLYDSQHAFVWELAGQILTWLNPRTGERILDLGCGTGHLTARLATDGATVLGIDSSETMIRSAQKAYPDLEFRVDDARTFTVAEPYDAVFSNATLHWIPEADLVVKRVKAALRPGGRFVAEFGGVGNVSAIVAAVRKVLEPQGRFAWPNQYYPTPHEYAEVLGRRGFQVERIELVPRLTPLKGPEGLRNWLRMFRGELLDRLPVEDLEGILTDIEGFARSELWYGGAWHADYDGCVERGAQ